MVSVLKYSRYYWYWRDLSFPQAGSSPATRVPYWVWIDTFWMEASGPLISVLGSMGAYADKK